MQFITIKSGEKLLVNTPLGYITIQADLVDRKGRKRDDIEVVPDLILHDGCKVKLHNYDKQTTCLIVNKTPERMIPGKREVTGKFSLKDRLNKLDEDNE